MALLICLLTLGDAFATNMKLDESYMYKMFTRFQNEMVTSSGQYRKLADLKKDPHSQSKDSPEQKQLLACTQFLNPILKKDKIRIDYFTGYADNFRDQTHDSIEIRGFRASLLSPCSDHPYHKLCGFRPINGNPFLLARKIVSSSGLEKTIEIEFYDAGISDSDIYNRARIVEQNAKSENVRRQFIQALKYTDILAYSGHSRFGGGPDFYPEHFLPSGGDDVAYYTSDKKGVKDMLNGLAARTENPYLIFMGSCDSKKHFSKTLAQAKNAPLFSLLSLDSVTGNDAYKQFINVMTLVLNEACPTDYRTGFEKFQLIKNAK